MKICFEQANRCKFYSVMGFLNRSWVMQCFRCIVLLIVFSCSLGTLQSQTFEVVTPLPSEIHESSGLIAISDSLFITHNDGGNSPTLYVVDRMGDIVRKVHINGVSNIDWEDLAVTADGAILVGDFGNNAQNRKDLSILKLPAYAGWSSDTLSAVKIPFSFGDQAAFPPPVSNRNYDCEAMACQGDSVFLFSKNWNDPFDGYTKMYGGKLNGDSLGIMNPVDSFKTGDSRLLHSVTSADIRNGKLFLLYANGCWSFDVSKGVGFTSPTLISFNHFSQKEAISVFGNTIYITDESTLGFGNLYQYNVGNSALMNLPKSINAIITVNTQIYRFNLPNSEDMRCVLYDFGGQIIEEHLLDSSIKKIRFESRIKPGIYVLYFEGDITKQSFKISIP